MNGKTTALVFIGIILLVMVKSEIFAQNYNVSINENPVQIFAYLFDQFPQDVNGTTMCSSLEIRDSLMELGWSSDNISVFLGEENMTKAIFLEQLNYLEQEVDENDLVFVYITAHGYTYCRDVLEFNTWFQAEYNQINTTNKIFLMESCHGGEFVEKFYDPGYSMSSVSAHELAIALIPGDNGTWIFDEPLFSGGISSHFWAKAMIDMEADTTLDGVVSLDELYDFSLPKIKKFYNETFEAYPNTADYVKSIVGYTENYPVPIVMDNLEYDLTLNATDFILNNEQYSWEDDLDSPVISYQEFIYFSNEKKVEVLFQISDRSDFNYYCYVNDVYQKGGSHSATGDAIWNFTIIISVEIAKEYNITFTAIDKWDNTNTKTTFVKYKNSTEKTSLNLIFSILPLLTIASFFFSKKRKD